MNFQTLIESREGGAPLPLSSQPETQSLSWSALGGPDRAEMTLPAGPLGLPGWLSLLGSPLEVFNHLGQPVWWGYLEGFTAGEGSLRLETSLSRMANRVAVRYTALTPGQGWGETLQTAWADDLPSQTLYGVKEALLDLGMLSEAAALRARDLTLKQRAFPRLEAHGSLRSDEGQGGRLPPGAAKLSLHARGWFETLAWKIWPGESGLLGHAAAQNGNQPLGEESAHAALAQSFVTPSDQAALTLSLRARREGTPGDSLKAQIRTDAAGLPGEEVLAEALLPGGELAEEAYPWVQSGFSASAQLNAGRTYWLVLQRTGSLNSSAFYRLGVDEALGFSPQRLRLYNSASGAWSRRSPEAHLLFKLGSVQESGAQIEAVAQAGGQFLHGVAVEAPTGLSVSPYQSGGQTCLAVLNALLGLGTAGLRPLLAQLTHERVLRVFPQGEEAARWQMQGGRLLGWDGHLATEGMLPAGEWVRGEDGSAFFPRRAHLDAHSGHWRLEG